MRDGARRRRMVLGVVALLCMLASPHVWAQEGTGNVEVRYEDTDPANFPTVSIRVTVLDPRGVPISGLAASDFDVFEDGQQVPVTRLDPEINEDVKVAVALAIDISGSMYEEIDEAKAEATAFVNTLQRDDMVAVIAFRGKETVNLDDPFPQIDATREIDFTTDKNQVLALIDSLDVPNVRAGETPLYDALFKAVGLTSRVSGMDYKFVLAFTDGNEKCPECRGSIMGRRDPIDEAKIHNIPMFTIGLGDSADESYLKQVALATGGSYTHTATPDELSNIYRRAVDQLKQQYVVTYQAKAPADGKEHKLDVKVITPKGEGSNVIAIEYPCPQKPGVRLFYLKSSEVPGQAPTEEPLEDGHKVKAGLTILPDLSACNPIAKVELYLNGQLVFTAENKPFHLLYDFYDLQRDEPGEHLLTIRAQDDAGNVSEDVSVKIQVGDIVPGPSPDVIGVPGTATPSAATAAGTDAAQQPSPGPTTPTMTEPVDRFEQIPRWAWAVAGLFLVLLLLVLVLLLTRRKPGSACPNCGRIMDPSWTECLFCASRPTLVDDATAPEQPVMGFVEEDMTMPEYPVAEYPDASAPGTRTAGRPPLPATDFVQQQWGQLGWLIVEQGEQVGRKFHLQPGDTSLGRAGTNDIVLNNATVSRQQAKIRLEADGCHLYNLSATNPTLINGQQASHHRLNPGDRIQVGDIVLVFQTTRSG